MSLGQWLGTCESVGEVGVAGEGVNKMQSTLTWLDNNIRVWVCGSYSQQSTCQPVRNIVKL